MILKHRSYRGQFLYIIVKSNINSSYTIIFANRYLRQISVISVSYLHKISQF